VVPTVTSSETPSPTASATAGAALHPADANCDQAVSAADVTAFLQAFSSTAVVGCNADVDGDGSLTAGDLRRLNAAIFED
jgi:hypothetical protein